MIIVDMGSGNTCGNSIETACSMIKALSDVDTRKHEVVIKWQLFEKAGKNIPLDLEVFERAVKYAAIFGYATTASVFDESSLDYLLTFNPMFIKISNGFKPTESMEEKMKDYKVIRSGKDLCCISEYPAKKADYESKFQPEQMKKGISDHTDSFDLFKKYSPKVYEVHFKLKDSTGLDAGDFARTPEQMKEIL
jgi:sialic acid synthase SpsE